MKTSKLLAAQAGDLYFDNGKPCRLGHNSHRYTSNGACVECIRIKREAHKNVASIARRKRNVALFSNLREHKFMVAAGNAEAMQQLADIFQYSPDVYADIIKAEIAKLHAICPNPRVLSRDDLLKFIRWDGTAVTNLVELEISRPEQDDPEVCLYHRGQRYSAVKVMEVLRGERLNVPPL